LNIAFVKGDGGCIRLELALDHLVPSFMEPLVDNNSVEGAISINFSLLCCAYHGDFVRIHVMDIVKHPSPL
jgi:hypothetical protein